MSEKISDDAMLLLPIMGALFASTCYGFAACYSKLNSAGMKPLAVATGSQVYASLMLIVPGVITWPEVMPSVSAWRDVICLGIACTGVAYILYFRILSREGVSKALSVTYLVPLFAFIWGWWFIDEQVTQTILLGAATILLGVALTTGMLKLPSKLWLAKPETK